MPTTTTSPGRSRREYRRAADLPKSRRMDLGLAVAELTASRNPGHCFTLRDIAAYCDCTPEAVRQIELRVLKKLRLTPGVLALIRSHSAMNTPTRLLPKAHAHSAQYRR